ncbi:hypothetical protein [Marinilabilia rubra]|uniref:Uncharacterized protein n=1 Tax=Marinilabilia rubra TaxID=2162893 RepID=A0A2U2BE83_9BACT|nr:hypothetical protein [Marinilabilia rubra]PWE01369.1 hypothetical protein DDZ16_02470 [Marinilabilia rubra]
MLICFVQPYSEIEDHPERLACYIQVSELFYENGELSADRNKRVLPSEDIEPENGEWGFVGKH